MKRDTETSVRGLYRRYDGEYVVVIEEVNRVGDFRKEVVFMFLNREGLHSELSERFFSSEYDKIVVDEKGVQKMKCDIKEHPDNTTGQGVAYLKVNDLEDFGKNLSTAELLEELKKREDSPLKDFDIEGMNEGVFTRDYVVGVPSSGTVLNGREIPPSVSVECLCNDLEEARKECAELHIRGKNRVKIYKRVFMEVE